MEQQKEKTDRQRIDVYDMVNSRIMELLEQGVVPWKQNWSEKGLPRNLISKKVYRGINVLLLNALGYKENWFLTFKQAKELGASIKKGESAHKVIYWKWQEETEEITSDQKKRPYLRYYLVFNIEQCENIPLEKLPQPITHQNDVVGNCEKVIMEMPQCPEITFEDDLPYYNVINDFINMPELQMFESSEAYYETVFHEMTHATGHSRRLNRLELTTIESTAKYLYSLEELTAELGACYLKALTGLSTDFSNNASYINGWLKFLKDNKRSIVYASTQAQKAVDFILDIHHAEVIRESEAYHE